MNITRMAIANGGGSGGDGDIGDSVGGNLSKPSRRRSDDKLGKDARGGEQGGEVNADLSYALAVTGAGFFAWVGIWAVCFLIREGIDGYRALEKFLLSSRKHKWRRVFIGTWR